MTTKAFNQFKENVEHVRHLHSIYLHLNGKTAPAFDVSDILRAEFVNVISALDCYSHEVVREGMLEVFKGKRIETKSFKKFNIPLESVKPAITKPSSLEWLEHEIIVRHSYKSFQQSKNLAEAFQLISNIKLWDEIAKKLGKTVEDLKAQLDLIVDRRNKIVHEADIDPSFPGKRWPIDEIMVNEAIIFIEKLVEIIDGKIGDMKTPITKIFYFGDPGIYHYHRIGNASKPPLDYNNDGYINYLLRGYPGDYEIVYVNIRFVRNEPLLRKYSSDDSSHVWVIEFYDLPPEIYQDDGPFFRRLNELY